METFFATPAPAPSNANTPLTVETDYAPSKDGETPHTGSTPSSAWPPPLATAPRQTLGYDLIAGSAIEIHVRSTVEKLYVPKKLLLHKIPAIRDLSKAAGRQTAAPDIEKADGVLIPLQIAASTGDQHEAVCWTYSSATRRLILKGHFSRTATDVRYLKGELWLLVQWLYRGHPIQANVKSDAFSGLLFLAKSLSIEDLRKWCYEQYEIACLDHTPSGEDVDRMLELLDGNVAPSDRLMRVLANALNSKGLDKETDSLRNYLYQNSKVVVQMIQAVAGSPIASVGKVSALGEWKAATDLTMDQSKVAPGIVDSKQVNNVPVSY
ncbi:hypothetical protein LTS18_000837 [Coniosporium uncinatum]|uniref:Uncharacterized protein n=1 Tax=Coniosporium uncinatum TaxID=93489 RepID=A0ACC3D8I2_9PEZI|nr:hypothetical protein LTS18_000837 [Coniosporium uncinatum]